MSASSRVTGVETKKKAVGSAAGEREGESIFVELTHARWRHFGWAVAGCAIGVLLLIRLGTVGRFLGAVVLLLGLWAARSFVRTLLHPAGALAVKDDELSLSPTLCAGTTLKVPVAEVRNAYLLRRALPWTTAGPVLVLETARGTFEYPRDWFGSDGDQRRLCNALNVKLGRI